MSYSAIVCRAKTRPHPNADRLQLADCAGYQCIVGKDVYNGQLGIVFPEGGVLSEGFCSANQLCRNAGGYLEDDRRVRALRLRGERSEGLWLELDSLSKWQPFYRGAIAEGHELRMWGSVDGIPKELCRKYEPPAVRYAKQQANATNKRGPQPIPKHYDTPQVRDVRNYASHGFNPSDRLIWTEKLHGTSARTGRVAVDKPLPWWKRLLNLLPGVQLRSKRVQACFSGTRNCMLDPGASGEKGEAYRQYWGALISHQLIKLDLENTVVYYEIVGYKHDGKPIMPPHSVDGLDKKDRKALPVEPKDGKITYAYGCEPGRNPNQAHIYRITRDGKDLQWGELGALAAEIGVPTVPLITTQPAAPSFGSAVKQMADALSRDKSSLGGLMEGVCVRSEGADGSVSKWLKHKSFAFCCLEGIARNDADYWDAEEVA